MTRLGLRRGARRIAPLAWPVFVGQVAVIAFSTVDTVMVARTSAIDLAALAVGASVYISIFVGLMGTVLAVGPIAGQLYGAGKLHESGHEAQQAMWLGLALAVPAACSFSFRSPSSPSRAASPRWRRGCASTSTAWRSRCRLRSSSPRFAASTSPCRGPRR